MLDCLALTIGSFAFTFDEYAFVNISLIAIGRLTSAPEQALIKNYLMRLPWPFSLREIEIKKPAPQAEARKAAEAERLLEAVPKGAFVIALDERGKSLSSRALASKIGKARDTGAPAIAFLIGGADGLDESIRLKADLVLSFGQLTWPHMLVRVMLAEQIYRAWSILNNHPYHRD